MTDWILYDSLTWPEVANLSRNCPLILPLGTGFDRSKLAETLNHPEQIVILPSFPFGWRGSNLPVPESCLQEYLRNLLYSLREDSFVNVFVLTPTDTNLGLGNNQIVQAYQPSDEFHFSLEDISKVVLIPIGHTEQHGYHLPLSTDTIIIEAIASSVVKSAPDQACKLPVMPYGVSTHRSSFAGTLNAGGRAFEDFWLAVIDVLVLYGFTRFYFMSGHGGNCSFLTNIVKYAGERHLNIFCATAFLYLTSSQGVQVLEQYRESKIGGMGHACELETSLMLHLRPDLVYMDRVVDEIEFIATPSYYMDWVEGGALTANPPWTDDTKTGAYGAGSLATREKGKIWFEAAVQEKINHVAEIHEQYHRRIERRRPRK
ncbi:MAG: creatininase family protein [Anaerolineales bacterium]|nr:creatininase family protein [Anaerolineales bacterium]